MNFNQFYFTEKKDYKIYCDMDSVICDWVKAYEELELSDKDFDDWSSEVGPEEAWKQIEEKGGEEFWSEMDWMPDGKELWDYIKKYNPTILSTPARYEESKTGKHKWIKRELGDIPTILTKDKHDYADENSILIDDFDKKINNWKGAGGIGILHTDTKDTIKQLKELDL